MSAGILDASIVRYLPVIDYGPYDGGATPVGDAPHQTYATREEALATVTGPAARYADVIEIKA